MKKIDTHSEQITIVQDGLQVKGWRKVCPCCHKSYETTSRSQKFCSPACNTKYTKRKKEKRKEYVESQSINRIAARSHSIAVATLQELVKLHVRKYECSCGCTKNLEVHHIDGKWLNNSPENLTYLCKACHAKVHKELSARYEQGASWNYSEEEQALYTQILK